jgi:hypothetical protein
LPPPAPATLAPPARGCPTTAASTKLASKSVRAGFYTWNATHETNRYLDGGHSSLAGQLQPSPAVEDRRGPILWRRSHSVRVVVRPDRPRRTLLPVLLKAAADISSRMPTARLPFNTSSTPVPAIRARLTPPLTCSCKTPSPAGFRSARLRSRGHIRGRVRTRTLFKIAS